MGRPYQCTTCGSREVYHHCRRVVCAQPRMPVAWAVPMDDEPLASNSSPTPPPTPPTSQVSNVQQCHHCQDAPATMARRGIHDGRVHDRLCRPCFDDLLDAIREYIPAPGKPAPLNKPGGMLMARWAKLRRIPREHAVTVLYCRGELIRARAMSEKGPKFVGFDRL